MTDDLKNKLFTKYENDLLLSIKNKVRQDFHSSLKYVYPDPRNCIVAGGYFASLINDPANSYNDLDIFILEPPYKGNHAGINAFKQDQYFTDITSTGNYIANDSKIVAVFSDTRSKHQYIFTKYATRQEVIKNFDFVHCMISYEPSLKEDNGDKLFLTRQMYDAALKKLLIPNKPADQIRSKRWNKFRERGYHEANSV